MNIENDTLLSYYPEERLKSKRVLNQCLIVVLIVVFFLSCSSARTGQNLSTQASTHAVIDRDHCMIDMGHWTSDSFQSMLHRAQAIADPGKRIVFLVKQFLGTEFGFESLLAIPPKGKLRVRLSAFDCITFGHYILAMKDAGHFDVFIDNLAKLRYRDPETQGLDSDPEKGNIFDFTYNILLVNAVKRGILKNISADIIAENRLIPGLLTRTLKPLMRPEHIGGGKVTPKYADTTHTIKYIESADVPRIAHSVQSGDMILFVQKQRPGRPENFFGHGAFIVKPHDLPPGLKTFNKIADNDSRLYFIHSSMSKGTDLKPLGVCFGSHETYFNSLIYDTKKLRPLSHYCNGVGWPGIVVLRPLNMHSR